LGAGSQFSVNELTLNLYYPGIGVLNPPAVGGDLGIQDSESHT